MPCVAPSSQHFSTYVACNDPVHAMPACLPTELDGVVDPVKITQLDHKWKLATVEAEAAEELRRGLGITQKVSQPRKKLN